MLAGVIPRSASGLRERKKAATRQELARAALRLAIERGMDHVVTEDIAAAAGVSPRTFNNYFASKYEAICSLAVDRAERTGAALRARPPGEPLRDALIAVVMQQYEGPDQPPEQQPPDQARSHDRIAGLRMALHCAPLRAEYLRVHRATQDALAAAIAERLGAGPDPDPDTAMLCQIIAGAINAATQAAMERWLRTEPPPALAPLMRTALRQLTADLPALLAPDRDPRSEPKC